MADWGLKISQPGYDVKTANEKQLLFTSKYKNFLADLSISFTLSLGSGGGTVTQDITHNYGYPPFFLVMADGRMFPDINDSATYSLEVKANSTVIRFTLTSSFSENVTIKCYVFKNRLE